MALKPKSSKPTVKVDKAKSGQIAASGNQRDTAALAVRPPPTPAQLDARQAATKTVRKASGPARKTAAMAKIKPSVVPPVTPRMK